MSVLILEPMDAEVMQWLADRHPVEYVPELADQPLALRDALRHARALVLPASVAVDTALLKAAPRLLVIGRMSTGVENIDTKACELANVQLVRATAASASAEAEFIIGALLALLRRVPVMGSDGLMVGRELGCATVGLIGMSPATRLLAQFLPTLGTRVVGYDPTLHVSDPLWASWGIEPLSLRELMEQSDGVAVQLAYFLRYRGLISERVLSFCKPSQVLVSLAHSALFDEAGLAHALGSGRMAAAWMDCMEPGLLERGRPLHGVSSLQITPRVGSTTRESRTRAAWAVARRIDELLQRADPVEQFRPTFPDELPEFSDDPDWR
jgi:phosphoglycerate dehydrogenase-like enzyme